MKYGCCVNLLPKGEAKTGIEYAGRLKALGYDYVELPLNELSKLSEPEFEALLQRLEEAGLPCLCCNDFMPASFQITGPRLTPREELSNYLRLAMGRLRRLGASYTVFGSPWSRSCPEGFPRERAFGQIADFLGMAGDEAARNGIVIAVEHNNRSETNMLNHFSDVVQMVRGVGHPNVRALCDYYHLRYEGDAPEVLLESGDLLVHTHIAQLENRRYLTDLSREPALSQYAAVLRRMGYRGGVSIEGYVDSPDSWEADARATLSNLRQVFG